jgi:HlyD family secretion protein
VSYDKVFRKVSLDRLASPERLDQLISVTDSKGWIALFGVGLLLVTGIAWGVVGSLPQNVPGTGILIKSGGVFEVTPLASGRVTDVAVAVGDTVTEGQVVLRIAQPDLTERLQEAKEVLVGLREQYQQILDHGSRNIDLQTAYLAQQRATFEQSIASAERSVAWYSEKATIQEQLVQEGLLTKQTLLTTRQQHDDAKQRMDDARSQLAAIAVKQLDLQNSNLQDGLMALSKIDGQERAIAELERELKADSEVVTPHTGRILEIRTEQGAVVSAGEPVLSLDLTGRTVKDLEAVMYVPSVYGKQIRVGMPILIAPSTVKQEEFGMMVATVTYVSDFPATSRGMQLTLKNDKLVQGLSGGDAPYEVRADLVVDPQTASRYKWSSSKGPPVRIQSGTLAAASITLGSKRPIDLVIPLIREYTGL